MMSYKLAKILAKDIYREATKTQRTQSEVRPQHTWLRKELLLLARRLSLVHSGTVKW